MRRALTHAEQVRLAADFAAILRPLWRTDAASEEAARNAAFALADGEASPVLTVRSIVLADIRRPARAHEYAQVGPVVETAVGRYYQTIDQEPTT